jgi:hypothetical protein
MGRGTSRERKGGFIYGFALSEASLPFNGPETVAEVAESMMLQYLARTTRT